MISSSGFAVILWCVRSGFFSLWLFLVVSGYFWIFGLIVSGTNKTTNISFAQESRRLHTSSPILHDLDKFHLISAKEILVQPTNLGSTFDIERAEIFFRAWTNFGNRSYGAIENRKDEHECQDLGSTFDIGRRTFFSRTCWNVNKFWKCCSYGAIQNRKDEHECQVFPELRRRRRICDFWSSKKFKSLILPVKCDHLLCVLAAPTFANICT